MTKEWYKTHGYNVSINIDQSQIDRAERAVMKAYVSPILPTADPDTNEDVAHCVADLAFLFMMQHSLSVTRGGTKEKTTTNSMNADGWSILEQCALDANRALKTLRGMTGADAAAKVDDICKFKFKTNFINT